MRRLICLMCCAWLLVSACGERGKGASTVADRATPDVTTGGQATPDMMTRVGGMTTPEPDMGGVATDVSQDMEPEDMEMPPDPNLRTLITHQFTPYRLNPLQEIQPCVSWNLNNEEPIYVERVLFSNNGAFHHSNWFFGPEDLYPNEEDGYWGCSRNGFTTEFHVITPGTGTLFAQSTQAVYEEQFLESGVVIKIPPHSKIIGSLHMLNLANREFETDLRMALEIVHPSEVETTASAFTFLYRDLNLHPQTTTHVTGECDFSEVFPRDELDLDLYWVLPHYHYLGNLFKIDIWGGPRDGEEIFRLEGFGAEPGGETIRPKITMEGAKGFKFTCGFNNPRDDYVGWGIGDQEMCVMLGLARSDFDIAAIVAQRSLISSSDELVEYGGTCVVVGIPKAEQNALPTPEEIAGPFYKPPSDGEDARPIGADQCEDIPPDAVAEDPVTLTSVYETVLRPSCTYSSCHDANGPIMNLDLETREGLHERLMNHTVLSPTSDRLVTPGEPSQSLLYNMLAECEPAGLGGVTLSNMPLNAPTLLDPALVAKLRDWIAAGAPDN